MSDDLKRAIEQLHSCRAVWRSTERVVSQFEGKTVWDGYVEVFDLIDHPNAKVCYAWSSPIDGSTKRKFYAVLKTPPVETPADAIMAAIASDYKNT